MTTTPTESLAATVRADGGTAPVSADELRGFKDELQTIAKSDGYNLAARRATAHRTRFCSWEGQSPDGRKHATAQDGKPAFPFEGAADVRHRLADMIVNERVMILTAAALRSRPSVVGLDLPGMGLGRKLTTLLNWMLANRLGADYVREIVRLASYQEGDSPGVAVLGVWWNQEVALEMRTLTLAELHTVLTQLGVPPDRLGQLEAQLYNPAQDAASAEALQQLLPELSPARARKMVSELREQGHTRYPAKYLKSDQPRLVAYRLYEDLFLPANTTHLQRARCLFLREWLTEVELRSRQQTHGYSAEFVRQALEKEGASAFPALSVDDAGTIEELPSTDTIQERKGLFEIITCLYRAVNEDSVPGIYYATFHHAVDVPAHARKLLEFAHGQYPFVWFSRELLNSRLIDSRGVPELTATEQYSAKLLRDSFLDHTSISTVPPLKVPASRGKLRLAIGPLQKIEERRPGEVSWMAPPQYPQSNPMAYEQLSAYVNEYFGRLAANVPPTLAQLHLQHMTTLFLASLTEALTQLLQLCQQFISDAALQAITGDDGLPLARSRAEIQGQFRTELTFDPRHLDLEYLKQVVELLTKVVLPIDTPNVVDREYWIRWILNAVNPFLGTHGLRPAEVAQANEVKDEQNNFVQIAAGIEPPMLPEGQNFPLRLKVLEEIAQKNPEAVQKLTPVSRAILEARVKHLQNQVQQLQNAQIGRAVGQPALGRN